MPKKYKSPKRGSPRKSPGTPKKSTGTRRNKTSAQNASKTKESVDNKQEPGTSAQGINTVDQVLCSFLYI